MIDGVAGQDRVEQRVWEAAAPHASENFWAMRMWRRRWSRWWRGTALRRRSRSPARKGSARRRWHRRCAAAAAGSRRTDRKRPALSLPQNLELAQERERLPAEKRNEDPLVFASYADFPTFSTGRPAAADFHSADAPALAERASLLPMRGKHRLFLIDRVDRANEQAANSTGRRWTSSPPYLVAVMTAENAYDLLPTIRSRSIPFHFAPLSDEEKRSFVQARGLDQPERRSHWRPGAPAWPSRWTSPPMTGGVRRC